MRYEISDDEWATIMPMLPNKARGVPRLRRPERGFVIASTIAIVGAAPEEDTMASRSQRSGKLDIRVLPEAKRVLQEAARARHTTVRQFVIDSALSPAQEVLAERNRIALDSEQWAAFTAALDAPAERHPRMERLLREPTIHD